MKYKILLFVTVVILFSSYIFSVTTEYKFPTVTGLVYNEWTNGHYLKADEGAAAQEATRYEYITASAFDLGIPWNATIQGIEVLSEGISGLPGFCGATENAWVDFKLSWNGGVNWTTVTKGENYDCIGVFDPWDVETTGGTSDTWGHNWVHNDTAMEMNDSNFMVRMEYKGCVGRGCTYTKIQMDYIKVRITYIGTPLTANYTNPTPENNSDTSSQESINVTSELSITGCDVTHNKNGSYVTESMGADCFKSWTGLTNGTEWNFNVTAYGLGGDTYDLPMRYTNVDHTAPTIIFNTLTNGSVYNPLSLLLNYTVNDSEGDSTDYDVWIWTNASSFRAHYTNWDCSTAGDSLQFSLYEKERNFSILPFEVVDDRMYRLYHFDSDTIIDETGKYDGGVFGSVRNVTEAKLGRSWQFDGGNDRVRIGDGTAEDDNFEKVCHEGCTFSFWTYSQIGSTVTAIGRWDATDTNKFFKYTLFSATAVGMYFTYQGSDAGAIETTWCVPYLSPAPNLLNRWVHHAFVYNPNDYSYIWVDGVRSPTDSNGLCNFSIDLNAWDDDEDTFLGVHDDSSYLGDYNGLIDEFGVWNYSMTNEEVLALREFQSANKFYLKANATDGSLDWESDIFEFVLDEDTCTYWNMSTHYVDCTDQCELDIETDYQGNDIIFSGDDIVRIPVLANLKNVGDIMLRDSCDVIVYG